jgi:hypothetical protein
MAEWCERASGDLEQHCTSGSLSYQFVFIHTMFLRVALYCYPLKYCLSERGLVSETVWKVRFDPLCQRCERSCNQCAQPACQGVLHHFPHSPASWLLCRATSEGVREGVGSPFTLMRSCGSTGSVSGRQPRCSPHTDRQCAVCGSRSRSKLFPGKALLWPFRTRSSAFSFPLSPLWMASVRAY